MIAKFRLAIVQDDQVVAMRTFPLEIVPGRSTVWTMNRITYMWLKQLGQLNLRVDDQLRSEIIFNEAPLDELMVQIPMFVWDDNPTVWLN